MKKDSELYSKEELEIIKNVENGNYKALSAKKFEKEKKKFQQIAKNTLKNSLKS